MPAFTLKRFQQQALSALDDYLRAARVQGAAGAFTTLSGYGYRDQPFGETPCVCLRIPTGGGKTLLAAHAVGRMAHEWPGTQPKPLALWLVPSDAIRTQTLAALTTPGHALREALAAACGDDVRVCDLEAVALLSPQDFDAHAVVVVATLQSFRVEDTEQRNVYAFSEALEPHFRAVPPTALRSLHGLPDALVTAEDAASAKAGREMLARFVGSPRFSLANWLALRRPYLIVDEAHNAKTERSFEALQRLNPALILELTATPLPKRSNVLFHVSAQQLQAEALLKLPVTLIEHTRGWRSAVFDAVQTQRLLEAEAQQEEAEEGPNQGAYIRPIVLLQAQNSTEPVNVEVLRTHLLHELHIPAEQVKVATGTQRELDGVNLNARSCPVRYIITVQALREGWDCPFAYVLCTVQSIRSSTAIEQLLGRVLRMPYATRRARPALNRAYAHVTEAQTGQSAGALADRLIDGLGFDPLDMASMIAPQLPLPGMPRDDGPLFAQPAAAAFLPALAVDLPADRPLPAAVAQAVAEGAAQLSSDGERQRVQLRGAIEAPLADALIGAATGALTGVRKGKLRAQVAGQIERHNALVAAAQAPANRGQVFAGVPRLRCRAAGSQGEWLPLEREAVLETVALNLLAEPISLEGFTMAEQGTVWELYLDGARVRVGRGDAAQLPLDAVSGTLTAEDLARWLAAELQHPSRNVAIDILPVHLRAFTLACVRHLMHDKQLPLQQLARHQHALVQRLGLRVAELRDKAAKSAFTQLVLLGGWQLHAGAAHEFRFDPAVYPVSANKRYEGRFRFARHFYPVVANLKDGGEEHACAVAIDAQRKVKHWVRNLDSDPVAGFWLPTSAGRFYPDFVGELTDGRVFAAEYKGEHLRTVPKEIEKDQVGKAWAAASGGRALFATLFKAERGMNVAQQIDAVLR